MPPQPSAPQAHTPRNALTHTQTQNTLQTSPVTQNKQQSLIRTDTNLSTQPFIPASDTQPVSSSQQQHVPRSANGEVVKCSNQSIKSSAMDEWLCFCCKQPGHLKKDFPVLPYCSKCRTRGHIPAKCPSKQQTNRPTQEGHEFRKEERNQNHEAHREEWSNRCLHCTGDHQSHDCPTR